MSVNVWVAFIVPETPVMVIVYAPAVVPATGLFVQAPLRTSQTVKLLHHRKKRRDRRQVPPRGHPARSSAAAVESLCPP